jgi:hypothetical protein
MTTEERIEELEKMVNDAECYKMDLANTIVGLESERDALLDALRAEEERNQHTYCAYCGWQIPLSDPDALRKVGEHIASCSRHPMRRAERTIARQRRALYRLAALVYDWRESYCREEGSFGLAECRRMSSRHIRARLAKLEEDDDVR